MNPHSDHKIELRDAEHLHNYTRHSYKLNDILFYGDAGDEKDYQAIEKLKKALEIPAKYEFVVYSGLKWSPSDLWEKQNVDFSHPIRIHLPAFTSTSTDLDVACGFCRQFQMPPQGFVAGLDRRAQALYNHHTDAMNVLELHITKGTHIGSVIHVSKHRHEKELILNAGATIEISNVPRLLEREGMLFIIWKGKTMV